MSTCRSQWWAGLTCDHIYERCPNRLRGIAELRRFGWNHIGGESLDPHGTDVCGWCLYQHDRSCDRKDDQ